MDGCVTIHLTLGDHGRPLRWTIRDRFASIPGISHDPHDPDTWGPCDLTKVASVRVRIQPVDRSRPTTELIAMMLPPRVSGVCQLVWPAWIFPTPGRYDGEISLHYPDGSIETAPQRLIFVVRGRL